MVAGGHFAHLHTVLQHGVTVAGNGLVLQLDADDAFLHSVGFLLCKGFLADELRLVKLAEHRQACHDGRDLGREFITIERQAHLEAQRVAAAQSAGFAAAACHELVPKVADELVGTIHLESILARVACPTDNDGLAVNVQFLARIEFQVFACQFENFFTNKFSLGTLDCQLAIVVGLVLEINVESFEMLFHPRHILVDVGGIDDQEKLLSPHFVDKQVVDRSSVGVAHHAIENLAVGCCGHVVCENVIDVAFCVASLDEHLAHVADVEHTACLANGHVLIGDVGVLNGHDEACKRRHQCVQCNMFVIETGFLFFHRFWFLLIRYVFICSESG